MANTIAIIGECMLELSQHSDDQGDRSKAMNISYGGDTLNTAVYLSRLGVNVDYVTALGDDNMSSWMLDQWCVEGVGCDLVERYADCVPGLYMIQTDEHGERSFNYWRDSAPAKRLFDDEDKARKLFNKIADHEWLYLSGITLALYSEASRERFIAHLAQYRKSGGKIAFDGNYRPRLWSSKLTAQNAFEAVFRLTNIALPTLEDELLLFGDKDKNDVIARLQAWGVAEIGLKTGSEGSLVITRSGIKIVGVRTVEVVDTTGAGDSFNAGYLAARLAGHSAPRSAEAGHNLACVVIQYRGAIIPLEKMPG